MVGGLDARVSQVCVRNGFCETIARSQAVSSAATCHFTAPAGVFGADSVSDTQHPPTGERRNASSFTTPVFAIGATVLFYLFAPQSPVGAEFIRKYFCTHPLMYVSTLMFFSGLAILVQKYSRLWSERAASRAIGRLIGDGIPHGDARESEQHLRAWCDEQAAAVQKSQLMLRVRETLHYLKGTQRSGLEEHLRYIAELASERLHQSYATIRTISWAIPIVGFLGTVIGITMAIANVTPEQLDSSLNEVTGGLSVAFDTTALALGMSIVMVFCSFAIERQELQVLNDVEQFGIETLIPLFSVDKDSESVSTPAVPDMVQIQRTVWTEQLTALQNVWAGLLSEHTSQLTAALGTELQRTLDQHRASVDEARSTYTSSLDTSTRAVVEHTEQMLSGFERRISAWQDALQVSSQFSAAQSEALHDLGAKLLQMTETEERLTALQKQLNDNLQALQLADTLEQTASSLTAAVHVLTTKTSVRTAA